MEKETKTYEEPTVEKVEFDFKTRIAASECPTNMNPSFSGCNLTY